jgi:hypothetical protein
VELSNTLKLSGDFMVTAYCIKCKKPIRDSFHNFKDVCRCDDFASIENSRYLIKIPRHLIRKDAKPLDLLRIEVTIKRKKRKNMNEKFALDVIQSADTEILAGTDLFKHKYSFKEVEKIIEEARKR